MTARDSGLLLNFPITKNGRQNCRNFWAMEKKFDYIQAKELARVFHKYKVKYMFIGKSGAIILGYPDTTQDIDVYPLKSKENCLGLVNARLALDFTLSAKEQREILRGKDFIQLRKGPFDIDLVFAPDGIENFDKAYSRSHKIEGLMVADLDDIIRSKEKAGRLKDKESLERLREFRSWFLKNKNKFACIKNRKK